MPNPRSIAHEGPDPRAVSATLALDLRDPNTARETFHGDVLLIRLPRHGLAALLDGGPTPGMQDGYVDQVFVLQQEDPSDFRTRTIAGAELHYAGRALFIYRPADTRLLFRVRESGDAAAAVESAPASAVATATRYEGFGLARRTGAWTVPLVRAADSLDALLPVANR